MSTSPKRFLIVNADDLGLSPATNQGIFHAHASGIVTSASLMTRYPAAREAAAFARAHLDLSLGLHFDIGEWACRNEEWVELYRVVEPGNAPAIQAELERQLEQFRQLTGRDPTHLDSHQHVHREEPARSIMLRTAQAMGVPLRQCAEHIRYDGRFYGQSSRGAPWPKGISVDGLKDIISTLPPGITELGCHPGLDPQLESPYRLERVKEVSTLCDGRVRIALRDQAIEVISFREAESMIGVVDSVS